MPQTLDTADAIWGLVLALHVLGMSAWIGGLAYALIVLRPSLGLLDATPRMNVHLQTMRRFFRLVWHVMPVVLITGWAMLLGRAGGFAHAPWYVNAMQVLGILMALAFLWVFFGPYRRLRRAIRPQPRVLDEVRSILITDLALGIATVIAATLGHFAQ